MAYDLRLSAKQINLLAFAAAAFAISESDNPAISKDCIDELGTLVDMLNDAKPDVLNDFTA